MATWVPTYLQEMGQWIQNPGMYMYGRWDSSTWEEGGVDLSSPAGTPVYALADGTVQGAGYFWHSGSIYTPNSGPPGNAVLTTRVNVPGYGLEDLYYQHIKLAPSIAPCMAGNCGGQVVHKGDLIGWIEQDPGEVEMGFNANWGGIWGGSHPGAWPNDPRPMILALMNEGPPGSTGGTPGSGTVNLGYTTSTGSDPFSVISGFISSISAFTAWLANPVRIIKIIAGIAMIGISLYMLVDPAVMSKATKFIKSNPEVLA